MVEQPFPPEAVNPAPDLTGNGDAAARSANSPETGAPDAVSLRRLRQGEAAREINQLDVVRPNVIERIKVDYPELPAEGHICDEDLDRFRSRYVSGLLGEERGELTKLEQDVVQSLADHETLAENIEAEWVGHRTVGEQLSDHLASFGGSWTFIIIFFVILAVWMAFNALTFIESASIRIPTSCLISFCRASPPSRRRSS